MQTLFYAVFILIAVAFQFIFVEMIAIKGIKPDFILIVLNLIALTENRAVTTLFGFFAGLFQDAFSPGLFGLSALLRTVTAFIFSSFYKRLKINHVYEPVLVTYVVAIFHNFLFYIFSQLGTRSITNLIFLNAIPASTYTLIAALVFFGFLPRPVWRRIEDKSHERIPE